MKIEGTECKQQWQKKKKNIAHEFTQEGKVESETWGEDSRQQHKVKIIGQKFMQEGKGKYSWKGRSFIVMKKS